MRSFESSTSWCAVCRRSLDLGNGVPKEENVSVFVVVIEQCSDLREMTAKMDEPEAITGYRDALKDLTINSKPQINMLTMLADDCKETAAPEIVRCIEQRMHSVSNDKKLPLLYLMDSICKNISGVYVKLFTQNIVSTFCHVFEKADEKTRLSLYKLRQTWNDIFPARKLYAVDDRIQKTLDPAWPVTAPKPESGAAKLDVSTRKAASNSQRSSAAKQQVHINPKFLNDAKQQVQQISLSNNQPNIGLPATGSVGITAQLYEKQQELLKIQKERMELDILTARKQLEEREKMLREREEKIRMTEAHIQAGESDMSFKKKGRKRARGNRSRSPSPGRKWNRNVVKSRSRSPMVQWSPKRQKGTPSPNRVRAQRSPGDNKIHPNAQIAGPSLIPIVHPVDTVPTTIPAPAILARNDIRSLVNIPGIAPTNGGPVVPLLNVADITAISCAPVTTVTNTVQAQVSSVLPQPSVVDSGNWCQDRDYRREFEAMMFEADQRLRSGALSSQDHDMLVRDMERAMHQKISLEIAPAFKQENLCVTPELTMLVDGRSRKLYYFDDSIAVVLMNGPPNMTFNELIKMDPSELNPRQISFEGKPTKVFIDSERGSNEFVLLEFNNQPQTFFHNEHEQRIKFGGPAKEIILNGKAYQAKFGGPPVEVWFSGDTLQSHSLRLDGPPPRVKLSETPRIDLWNQIIVKATKKPDPPKEIPSATDTAEPPVNINDLLQKLVSAGIINKTHSAPETGVAELSTTIAPTLQSVVDTSSQNLPPEPVLILTPESLKVPRPSVVASLYNGIQCTNCSLRFDDKENTPNPNSRKTNYAKHLDWHFRQNRKDKVKPSASSASLKRMWYYPLNLWLQFKEVSDEDESAKKVFDENMENEDEEVAVVTVPASSDESMNQCSVCCEKFDLIWVEEEEEWRLKNAVQHEDGKNYHPLCVEDFLKHQHEEMSDEISRQVSENETSITTEAEEITATEVKEEVAEEKVEIREDFKPEPVVMDEPMAEEVKKEELVEDSVIEEAIKLAMTASLADEKADEPEEGKEVNDAKASEVETADQQPISTERDESVSVLKNEREIKESPLRLEIMPSLVSRESKLTMNLKSKINTSQKEAVVPAAKKEDKEVPVIVRGVEKSALCAIM